MTGIVAEANVPSGNQWLFGTNVVGLDLQDMSDAVTDDDFMCCNPEMDVAPSRRRKGSLQDASVVGKKKNVSKRSAPSGDGPHTVPDCALHHHPRCDAGANGSGAISDVTASLAPRSTQLSRERRGGGATRKKKHGCGAAHGSGGYGGGNDSTDDALHNVGVAPMDMGNATSSSFGLTSPKDWVSIDTTRGALDSPTDEWYRPGRDGDGMATGGAVAEGGTMKSDGVGTKKRSKASRHHSNHFDDNFADDPVDRVTAGGSTREVRKRGDVARVAPTGMDGKKLSSTSASSALTDEARSSGITGCGGSDDWLDEGASSSTTLTHKAPRQHIRNTTGGGNASSGKPPASHNPWNMGPALGSDDAMSQFESLPTSGAAGVVGKKSEKADRAQPRDNQAKKQRRSMSKDTVSGGAGGGGRSSHHHHRENSFAESADESFASLTFNSTGGAQNRGLPRLGQQGNSPGSQFIEVDSLAVHAQQQQQQQIRESHAQLLQQQQQPTQQLTSGGWSLASLGALPPILTQPSVPSSKHGRTSSHGAV